MDNQGKIWYGKFGTDQMYRNLHKDFESWNNYYKERFGKTKLELNNLFLKKINRKIRILEIGCNVGYQLNCLNKMGFKNLYGIELQSLCIKNLKKKFKFINLVLGDGNNIPFKKNFFDLVFTSNVLIHIHPSNISHFMSEMYRVTSKWIWCFEYYSKKYENVNYRNHKNLLWKTDFSKKFISTFTDLKIQKEILFKSLISNKEIDSMFLLKKK